MVVGSRRDVRAGFALFVVLATFVLTVTACAALARVAHLRALGEAQRARDLSTSRLAAEAERPILAWLAGAAGSAVLPPDATSPRFELLHDAWSLDGVEHRLSVVAYDQLGMVSLDQVSSGSPLSLALPPAVSAAIPADAFTARPAGLDLMGSSELVAVFPAAPWRTPERFGADGSAPARDVLPPPGAGIPAVGEYVGTHNPGAGRINVNTAPLAVLSEALRLLGRDGIEGILAARREGRMALVGGAGRAREEPEGAPELVSTSDVWAFRVDASVGATRSSWWLVYARNNVEWSLVQRLTILG